MFDVYRNGTTNLLVLELGSPIPAAYSGKRWRKSRRRILKVSEEIKSAVQQQGYYVRSLRPTRELVVEVE
ncbi:intracellular growth attenuator family protein [Bradyrhizobium huanghuaihaiense]|uniref:intracellular growth attenuator family protein n=1 Tax=Bradyrhizobium huanghuaihaiense TaxID=990078 RepID=UPI0021AA390E|nr:intracellular growth attenuator family protein [Bradyrhizobium sp. CB3035]UWU79126.1 intracellular growth attenuator family protein [Bradyrhizobium sp. CB3035]